MLLVFLLLMLAPAADAYSVLTHEEVVDLAWPQQIVPMLRARYPGLTDQQITEAHAYAYGGSVIQDMGYYPFGNAYFSDLVHYVRTGDFVATLIRESSTPDEFAFAMGALAHYCGDVAGHPAVNKVTSDEYPKLRSRFGPIVTYADNHTAHVRTEFGFDVVEVAHGRYSQQNYRDFIGFQVAKPLLDRAFEETYGLPIKDVLTHEDLAIGSYRRAVSQLIPKITVIALVSYNKQIEAENPGFDHEKFVYRLRRTEFEKEYGTVYVHPGFGSRLAAFFFALLPKVGPLRALKVKVPTPDEQDLYLKSVNKTVDLYRGDLSRVKSPVVASAGKGGQAVDEASGAALVRSPDLPEIDLDTGKPSRLGEYQLADTTYAKLLDGLLHRQNAVLSADVRDSFTDFYKDRKEPEWYRKKPDEWKKLQADLQTFDSVGTVSTK